MLTLEETRTHLFQYADEADPYSPLFVSRLNQVIERFHNNGQWEGMVEQAELTVEDGHAILPVGFQSLLGIRVDGVPQQVVTKYYDFMPTGSRNFLDINLCHQSGIIVEAPNAEDGRRRYRIGYTPSGNVIGLMQRGYVRVANPDDPVVPSNLGALKAGLMALNFEDKNDMERATQYWQQAMGFLNAEMQTKRGAAQYIMPFQPHGMGVSPVPNIT